MFEILFTATIFISFVILLRFICRNRISARLQYAIWLLVAAKLLIFPMPGIEGDLSVMRLVPWTQAERLGNEMEETVPDPPQGVSSVTEVPEAEIVPISQGMEQGGGVAGTDKEATTHYDIQYDENEGKGSDGLFVGELSMERLKMRMQRYLEKTLGIPLWLFAVMAAGSLCMAIYMAVYHIRLGRCLHKSRVLLKRNADHEDGLQEPVKKTGKGMLPAYSVEGLPTPCLFGRSIYIPDRLSEDEEMMPYILEHEMCHYRHRDGFWGFVRMLCICLYWYHPLVWLAACLSRQDCELACDEAAVRHMKGEERKLYGELLLELAFVKQSPAECFSISTAMSGNAKTLKRRLERIAGRKKYGLLAGIAALVLVLAGIFVCVTSGTVSVENQRQSIEITEEDTGNVPFDGSYNISYDFSQDAASYGIYMEQYEFGELTSADICAYGSLANGQPENKSRKKGEAVFSKTMESDAETGAYTKFAYSIQDLTGTDGPTSVFATFQVNLPAMCLGNSFSLSGRDAKHHFGLNDDVILVADYYGDDGGRLQIPVEHKFDLEEYHESTDEILKFNKCVILVHLVVSESDEEDLRKQLEEKLGSIGRNLQNETGANGVDSSTDTGQTDGQNLYTNEELIELAREYYRRENGFAPSHVEIDSENDNMVTLWLYDMNEFIDEDGEVAGSANTRDWYTIDRTTGKGENIIFDEIDLSQVRRFSEKWEGTFDESKVVDRREEMNSMEFPPTPEAGTEDRIYFLGETENYTLYGLGDYQSMLLYDGAEYTQIFQPFIIDGFAQTPGIQEADYDGDGETELAIKLLWGRGTGIWQEKLWMADRTGGEMKVYEYFDGIYGEELIRRLSWKKEEGGVRITLDGKAVTPLLRDGESGASYDHMGMDTGNTSFAFSSGEIRAKTLIACGAMESSVLPAYHKAYLDGKVAYQGNGRFTVTDIKAGNLAAEETAAEAVRAQYGPQEISIVDYQYDMATIAEGGLEMVAVVLQEGTDSYDYATVPMTVDEEGNWSAGEVLIEK